MLSTIHVSTAPPCLKAASIEKPPVLHEEFRTALSAPPFSELPPFCSDDELASGPEFDWVDH